MTPFRRLCTLAFAALATAFCAEAAADTYDMLVSPPQRATPYAFAYGDRVQVGAEVFIFTDSCDPAFVPGPYTLQVDGAAVADNGWYNPFDTCVPHFGGFMHVHTRYTDYYDTPLGTHVLTVTYTPTGATAPVISRSTTIVVNPDASGMTGAGMVQAGIMNPRPGFSMSWYCTASSVQVHADSGVGAPPGTTLESGVVEYAASGCSLDCGFLCPGGTPTEPQQRVMVQMPQPIPADEQFWVYSTGPGTTAGWQPIDAQVQGNSATLMVTGGPGQSSLGGLIAMARPFKLSFAVQDMWWAGPEENGWGLSIAQNGDRLFVGMYVYRDDGAPEWLVMPLGSWNTDAQAYVGQLYEPKGSWFGAYNAAALDVGNPVGQASLTFSSDSTATLDYTIRGISGHKAIRRLPFGSTATPPAQGARAGLWWAGPARTGWGLAIGHQGNMLFAVWYTYAKDGTATWYVMPGGSWSAPDTFSGALYRTTGKSWLGGAYDPAALKVVPAGTLTLHFTGPATADMTYSVDGTSGTESISLQPF